METYCLLEGEASRWSNCSSLFTRSFSSFSLSFLTAIFCSLSLSHCLSSCSLLPSLSELLLPSSLFTDFHKWSSKRGLVLGAGRGDDSMLSGEVEAAVVEVSLVEVTIVEAEIGIVVMCVTMLVLVGRSTSLELLIFSSVCLLPPPLSPSLLPALLSLSSPILSTVSAGLCPPTLLQAMEVIGSAELTVTTVLCDGGGGRARAETERG